MNPDYQKKKAERIDRARKLAASVSYGDGFFVSNGHKVTLDPENCDCEDFTIRRRSCKHIYAVRIWRRIESKKINQDLNDKIQTQRKEGSK